MDEDLDDQLYEYDEDLMYDEEESEANLEQDLHGLIDSGLIDEQLQQTILAARNDMSDNPPANPSPFSFIFQESQADLQYREMEIQRLEQHLIQLAKKDDPSSSSIPSSNSNNKDSNAALDTLNPTKHEDRTWNSIDDKQLFGDETLMDEKYYEALQQLGQHVVEDHLSDAPLSWSVEDNDDIVGLLETVSDAEDETAYHNLMRKYIQNVDSWASVQSTSNLMFLKRMRLLQRIHLAISREKERLLIPPKPVEFPQPTPAPTPAPAPAPPTSSSKSKRASKSAEKQNTPPPQVLDKLINTKQSMNDIIKKFLSSSVIAKLPLCLTHESPENVEKFQTRLSQYMKGKSQPQYIDQRVQATVAMILLALSTGSVRWLLHAVRSLLDDYSVNSIKSASSEWIKYPIAGYLKRLDKFRKYTEISAIVPEAYLKSFRYYWNPKLSKQKSRLRSLGAPPGQVVSELVTTDGSFVYIYSDRGLVKVGTGYNGTIAGKIYDSILGYRSKDKLVDIVCVRDKLCLISSSIKAGCVLVLNASTLQEEGLVDFAIARDTAEEIVQINKEHMVTSTNNRIRLTSDGQYLYTIIETTCTLPLDPPPSPTPTSPQPSDASKSPIPPAPPTPPTTPPATPAPPPTTTVKKYWADIFNIGSNAVNQNNATGLTASFVRRVELRLPTPLPPSSSGKTQASQMGHEGISCNACHRIAFRLKRYQCKVCANYNLCSTCYSSGVFANNQSSIGHRPEHYMEAIDIPIPPPPPASSKAAPAPVTSTTAPFTFDAFNRCCFYATGHQLGIVFPPKVLPNKTDKNICRVFDLNASNIAEEGNFIYDIATESYANITTCCYDRTNNLLWTLHQYNHALSQFRNFGPAALVDPSYSPDAIMANPKFSLPSGSPINLSSSGGNTNKAPVKLNPILPEVVAVNILGQLDLIHKKQLPLSESDDSSQMINSFHRIHFGPEPSVDNINELLSLLDWGMHRYMENIHSASAVTQQLVIYLIVSCLRLLRGGLHYAFQVPDPIFKQAINTSDTDIINRTFLIASRLFESTVDDPEQSPIHAELTELLLSSLDAFFPTPQKKADVVVHLLAGNGLVRDGISVRGPFITDGKLCKKFVECFMTSMLKTISVEHVITETTGPTHVPNKLLPVLIEESNRELYSYYQTLVNSLSNPAQVGAVPAGSLALQQPNLALRLLCNFQKELFSNSPSEAIVHLTLYYSKLIFDASIDLVKKTIQLHHTIAKTYPDSTPDSVFRTLENVLEYSILGTVLPTHLVSLGLFLENVGSRDQPTYPLHFLPPLKDLLTHLDLLNKLFPSLAQSEIKYLQHVIPTYDTASKVAESPHPYTEYTNKEITVSVPGALCLYVYFDPKCETESESDYVQIWRRKNEPISKKFYGTPLADSKENNGTTNQGKNTWPEKPLVIPGDSMVIYLHSEGQASRTHRWGFRIFVKGIMSTHPVNISWYFDLEKTAAVLAGKLVESLISGDFTDASIKLKEEEHALCKYSFVHEGVEESVPNDNPSDVVMQDASQHSENSMQVEASTESADTFLRDLIEGKGRAFSLHTQLLAKLKPKILPVPKSVEVLVETTSRHVLAVLLKLSNAVHQAVSASSTIPSVVLDVWTAVYATRVRRWLRLLVQQARSGTTAGENENVSSTTISETSTPEISVESAYQAICANVQSLCAFLMKLNPGRSAPSSVINEVLAFVESSPKVTSLSQLVGAQALRAQYRSMGFKLVIEFLNSVSLGSVKQDILASVGQAIRRNSEENPNFKYHYLAGLETCSPSLKQSVCASFDSLIQHILVMLNQSTSDYRLQLLVMDCLNLVFKPRDCELLSRLDFTQLIHQLAIGKISVWNLSVEDRRSISLTNPVVNTSLPPSEITPENLILSSASSSQLVEQLVGGCCEVGKTVGPVVPQRFTHQQVAAKGLAKEQEFTISLWVYPIKAASSQPVTAPVPAPSGQATTSTSWRTIIFKGTDAPENQKSRSPALFYSVEDLSLALCVSTASNWNVCLRSASEVPFDQWSHVACVLDNNVLAIYINGIRDSEMILGEPIIFNEHPFCIGTTPQAINEKLGFHGFVENVQYYYSALTDSNMIKLIQKSTPLPPEFTQRHKHDTKKLKYLGTTLFNLLAIDVLTWHVDMEDQQTQKRIQHFQNSIIEILVTELGDELTAIQQQMNSPSLPATDADKLYDDERCYEILVLIFKLRKAVPVCRYFSQPAVIVGLAERVLQENTPPRIQRLLLRLYRHILMHANPVELAQSSQGRSLADFLLSKVGSLYLVGSAPGAHPDSTETPMTIDQTSPQPTSPRDIPESFVVMLHSCPGLTPDEVSRALQKQITKEISAALSAAKTSGAPIDLFSYIRGIALEAQEMGKAVLKTGPKDDCIAIAVKLAKAGFVCTLIEVPNKSNDHSDNRNIALSASHVNPRKMVSGQIAYGTACEIVTLFRLLWKTNEAWGAYWRDYCTSVLMGLNKLLQAKASELVNSTAQLQHLERTFGVLSLLGGLSEGFRVGCKVEVHSEPDPDSHMLTHAYLSAHSSLSLTRSDERARRIASIIEYDRLGGIATIVYDSDSARKAVIISVGYLRPIPEISLLGDQFPLTGDILSNFASFLKNPAKPTSPAVTQKTKTPAEPYIPLPLEQDNPLVYSHLKTLALRSFLHLLQSKESVLNYLALMQAGSLPLLTDVAASFGQVRVDQLNLHEQKILKIVQKLHEGQLNHVHSPAKLAAALGSLLTSPLPSDNTNNNTPSSVKKPRYKDTIPYSPYCNNEDLLLPTSLTHKGSEVHHAIPINERTIEFYGYDGDELTLVSENPIPSGVPEFYFEIRLEMDSLESQMFARDKEKEKVEKEKQTQGFDFGAPPPAPPPPAPAPAPVPTSPAKIHCNFSIGIVPTTGLPVWANGAYGYHSTKGQKSSVVKKEAFRNLPRYKCPFCKVDGISERELCFHVQRRHANGVKRVVCPICASSPFGNPNYVSNDFRGHLSERHSRKLPPDTCPPVHEKYGPTFNHGDIIGCGYNKEEGTVYFTLNGKYLGIAFINVEGGYYPMVALRTPNTRVTANFGQEPFAFDPNSKQNKSLIRKEEKEYKEKLKKDEETRIKKEQEEQAALLSNRLIQASMLQGFVGFPLKYCMHALQRNNENIELAAEWAMTNFEAFSIEHPELFENDDDFATGGSAQPSQNQPSQNSPSQNANQPQDQDLMGNTDDEDEDMDQLPFENLTYHLGYTYSLSQFDKEDSTGPGRAKRLKSSKVNLDQLQVGQQLFVNVVDYSVVGRNWVPSMEKTLSRTGIVKEVDSLYLEVLLQFIFDEDCTNEEWWYPVRVLTIPSRYRRDSFPGIVTADLISLIRLALDENDKLAQLYICKAATMFEELTNVYHLDRSQAVPQTVGAIVGGPPSLINLLQVVSREYMTQPLPDLSMNPCKSPFLEKLRTKLNVLCTEAANNAKSNNTNPIVEVILQESLRMLKTASDFVSKFSIVEESEHPYIFTGEVAKKIHIDKSSALFVTFEKKSRLAGGDKIVFYADDEYSSMVAMATGAQFVPTVIPSDTVYIKYMPSKDVKGLDKSWGYRYSIAPSIPEFNMSMWLLQYLMSNASHLDIENIHVRIFKTLFTYLYNTSLPIAIKVIVLRMLTRILQVSGLLPDDIKSSDPRRMRDTLRAELEELLRNPQKSDLASPYLQSLAELMVETKFVLAPFTPFYENVDPMAVATYNNGYLRDMSLFDKLCELKMMVKALQYRDGQNQMPFNAVVDAVKMTSLSENMDESTYVKVVSQSLNLGKLKDITVQLFNRFDINRDGILNEEEFNHFLLSSGQNPYSDNEPDTFPFLMNAFAAENGGTKGFTIQGLIAFHEKIFATDRAALCRRLRALGVDSSLSVVSKETETKIDYVEVASQQNQWSLDMDEQLVQFINELTDRLGCDVLSLTPAILNAHNLSVENNSNNNLTLSGISNNPNSIWRLPLHAIKTRFAILKIFNDFAAQTLPLIDLSQINVYSQSFAHQLSTIRSLLFYDIKMSFLREALTKTAVVDKEPPMIYLDRLDALKQLESDVENSNCVFIQAMKQLHPLNTAILRQKERAFKVVFKGEHAEGEVGPYRESISQMCMELHNEEVLPLLIPCPNQQLAKESIGVGENREKFIINPATMFVDANKSSQAKTANADFGSMYEFFGKLIGIAIRSKNPLSLDLPSVFWKPLVGQKPTRQDLKEIDYSTIESLESIEAMDENTFNERFAELQTFSTLLSDRKTSANLIPNGDQIQVTYENRHEFVKLKVECLLNESKRQMDSIMKGLRTIVPVDILKMFSWRDIRYLVCGNPDVDLELLKKHTRYRGGVKNTDSHIMWFWETLEEFSPAERSLFLRFAWGRERLPPEREFSEEMKIFPSTKTTNHDNQLPHADTCFFNVSLPAYTSKLLMKEKLLIAITHTMAMDGDTRADQNDVGFGLRAFREQNMAFIEQYDDDDDY